MPNVTLHFYAANDLNGDVLLEVTDEDDYLKGVELRVALDELGGGSVRLARDVGFALFATEAVEPEVFVRVLVHAYSDTDYFWGFFLDKREQKVVGLEGTEEYQFGGPGPKQYLDRAALSIEQYTGTGWQIDLDAGVFRWKETATAGRILNRIIEEDAANPVPALPDLTKSFSATVDSDADAWTNTVSSVDDDFELPIGQSILRDLWELEDLSDLETRIYLGTVAAPVFRLDALPVLGTDYSGDHFDTDILRFAEGSTGANPDGNIGAEGGGVELTVKGQSIRKATHVIVKGRDGTWAVAVKPSWSPGDYVKYQSIEYARSNNVTMLEKAGIRWLRRQEAAEAQIDVPIISGITPAGGRYFPDPDGLLWVGNTCSLFTGGVTGTPLDYRDDPFRVTGIKLDLLPASVADSTLQQAMSWQVVVQLNYERGSSSSSPSQATTGAHTPGPCCGPRSPIQSVDGACSRLYFSTAAASISTQLSDASWADDGSAVVHLLKLAPDDTIPAGGGSSDFIVGINVAAGSYVRDDGLDAYQITDAALLAAVQAGGIVARAQMTTRSRHGIGVSEAAQEDYQTWLARVYRAGTGFIGTLWGLTGGGTRFLPQSTFVNRSWAAASTAVPGAALNDWIVFEIGARHVGPTSGAAGAYYRLTSDSAVEDLPQDEVTTSVLNSWIEICTAGSEDGSPPLSTVRAGEGSYGSPGTYVPVGSTVEMGLLSEDGQHYLNASDVEYDGTESGLAASDVQEAITELAEAEAAPHAHDPPTAGVHKILIQRTTNLSVTNSNDSVPDYDTVIEDTMTDSWWDAGDPDGFLVTAPYDGQDAIFMAKGALSDPGTSDYLEAKMYLFPAASGRNRPIHASTDEQYLLAVEQQPAHDNVNHFVHIQSDPVTVQTGDRLFVAWRTSTAQTVVPYDGRVSLTLGAYILGSSGAAAAEGPDAGYWEPVTNGDVGSPEIVFDAGDVVMEWVE